jgi:acyl carrier protein
LAATVANESHTGPVATPGSPTGRDAFEARLLAFVNERLLAQAGVDVGPDTYLFADGLVNSMRILDLVAFIERSLDLTIDDTDVTMEHFRTVRTIADSFASRGARS